MATRLSQLISVIHLEGLAGDVLRSRAAPPGEKKTNGVQIVSIRFFKYIHEHVWLSKEQCTCTCFYL